MIVYTRISKTIVTAVPKETGNNLPMVYLFMFETILRKKNEGSAQSIVKVWEYRGKVKGFRATRVYDEHGKRSYWNITRPKVKLSYSIVRRSVGAAVITSEDHCITMRYRILILHHNFLFLLRENENYLFSKKVIPEGNFALL